MAYDVTYNADFNILATITAPLFKSTDPNIKLDTNATLSLANLMASHINRRYKAVPTKVGAATVRLDSAYGSAPIQEFVKEKVANGYIYSVKFNVAWEIFGATIDVSSRIDKDQSALDEIKHDLEWELSSDFNTNNIQPTYSMSMRLHIAHIAVVALGTCDKINEHLPPKPTWIIHKGFGGFLFVECFQ